MSCSPSYGAANRYSGGVQRSFLLLALFVIFALGRSFAVPSRVREVATASVPSMREQPLALAWVAEGSVPWAPECAGVAAAKVTGVS